jgi:RNA polymerase sigma-70 factor (ECF subfamily)
MSLPQSADELLRHAAWVRRVARALVRGPDRIDELEQETWLAAFSHPPRHTGDQRSWIGAVTRNVAKHLFRSEATRERHERDPARAQAGAGGVPGSSPAAGEIVARAEIQQRVAAAVLALEEPYKSTLLARYFDELPPTEIARALDISVETVKTRLKRGLAQLRVSLDSLRDGGATLEAVLLPLCGPAVGAAWPVVTKGLLVAATLAIGATILVPRAPRVIVRVEEVSGTVEPEAAVAAASPLAPVPAAVPQDGAPVSREPIGPPTPPPVAHAVRRADAPVRLVGRIVLPDGGGAADVLLRLTGSELDAEKALKYGVPDDWKPVESRSLADGSFSIEFPAPRAFQFILEAKLPGFAAVNWRWLTLEPTSKDLGEVTLLRTGTIHGRIVDRNGRPVRSSRWMVHAESPPGKTAVEGGVQPPRADCAADPTTWEFLLEDVPSGTFWLWAESPLAGRITGPHVEVRIGERTEADIVVPGPDLVHRITVELSSSPFDVFTSGIFEDAAPKIVLTGNGIDPRDATASDSVLGTYVFDDVPDGRYTVEVRDPKYLPWQHSDVANGTSVVAELKGNARVRLKVVDVTSGKEIPRYSLRTRFEFEWNVQPDTVELLRQGAEPPRDGVYDGLMPVNQVLHVVAPGYAEWSLPLRPLAADRVTELTAKLTEGATLSGIVLRSDGTTPSPYTPVHLEPREGDSQSDDSWHSGTEEKRGDQVATSQDTGRFWFHRVGVGHFTIRTEEDDPALEARIEDVEVREDTPTIANLELVLPPSGFLSGRLLLPKDAHLDGLDVVAVPVDETDEQRWDRSTRALRSAFPIGLGHGVATPSPSLRPDGTFRVGPLTPGIKRVRLRMPVVALMKNGYTGLGLPTEIDLPRIVDSRASGTKSGPDAIDTVTIVDGEEARADFDARSNFPGRLRIVAELRGASSGDVFVQATPVDSAAATVAPALRVDRFAIGQLDVHGTTTLAPIPATKVRLFFTTSGRLFGAQSVEPWCWFAPGVYEVASNVETEVPLVIEFIAGDVLVVDPAGEPVASHWFDLGCDDASLDLRPIAVMTDPQGRLHLRLPPGHYCIRGLDWKSRKEPASSFEWTQYGLSADAIHVVKPG